MNDKLRRRYAAQFASIATARLKRGIAELATNPTIVGRELHSLAGEAGMLGLTEIADAAADASGVAREWREMSPTSEQQLAFARRLRALMTLVAQLEVAAEPASEPERATENTALIVEDSELVADELADALDLSGFASTIAATFDAATRALASKVPDVVLLDANLPGVDLEKLCVHIRQHATRTKIVLVSGVAETELAAIATKLGADSYVSKLNGVRRVIDHVSSIVRKGAA